MTHPCRGRKVDDGGTTNGGRGHTKEVPLLDAHVVWGGADVDGGVVLDPGEGRELGVIVTVGKGEPRANYTGDALVVYRRV